MLTLVALGRVAKKIGLIWSFYQTFIFTSLLITACCLVLFWEYGFSIFNVLFWFKLATLGLTCYFINRNRSNEFYYYQNLGLSKMALWSTSLSFDFALFVFLIIQTYRFK